MLSIEYLWPLCSAFNDATRTRKTNISRFLFCFSSHDFYWKWICTKFQWKCSFFSLIGELVWVYIVLIWNRRVWRVFSVLFRRCRSAEENYIDQHNRSGVSDVVAECLKRMIFRGNRIFQYFSFWSLSLLMPITLDRLKCWRREPIELFPKEKLFRFHNWICNKSLCNFPPKATSIEQRSFYFSSKKYEFGSASRASKKSEKRKTTKKSSFSLDAVIQTERIRMAKKTVEKWRSIDNFYMNWRCERAADDDDDQYL